MPFELGVVVGWQNAAPTDHDWFVFESSRHRLQKSLSDLNGTDPFIYGLSPEGILREIRNALSRHDVQPTAAQMQQLLEVLREDAVPVILNKAGTASLFNARPFKDLVVMARQLAEEYVPGLKALNHANP